MRDREHLSHRPDGNHDQESPSILTLLIVANLGIHMLRSLFWVPSSPDQFPPGYISHAELIAGHWWTLFTHLFVHLDFVHLSSNLLMLWLVGRSVLKRLGTHHFVALYFLGGWAGTAAGLFLSPQQEESQIIGASGAIFALLGAFGVLFPHYSITEPFRRWVTFRLSAKWVVTAFIMAALMLELLYRITPNSANLPGANIGHLCHAVGGLFGMFYAWKIARPLAPPFRRVRPSRPPAPRDLMPSFIREDSIFLAAGSAAKPQTKDAELRRSIPEAEELTDHEFMQQSVDPILEKLHAMGMQSLTDSDQKILREAADRLRK
jgi:membrane associated rhomboid family serine protease